MTSPTQTSPTHEPYPDSSDSEIRKFARIVRHGASIATLDKVKKELLGDPDKAYAIAQKWVKDTTMTNTKDDIEGSTGTLARYWEGRAKESFDGYAKQLTLKLQPNSTALHSTGSSLAHCATTVFTTWNDAVKEIGNCAVKLHGKIAKIALGSLIPTLSVQATLEVIDILSEFVQTVNNLIITGKNLMLKSKEQAVEFSRYAAEFQALHKPDGGAQQFADPAQWRVRPAG